MKNSHLYYLSSWAVVVVFFLCRVAPIIPNWIIFYDIVQSPLWEKTNIEYKIVCILATIPLDCLNLFWFNKIIKSFSGYLKERTELTSDEQKANSESSLNVLKQKLNAKKIFIGEHFSKFKIVQLVSRSERHEKSI